MTHRLRAAHVVSSIDPKGGGPSYTVPALIGALARNGQAVELFSNGHTSLSSRETVFHHRFSVVGQSLPFVGKLHFQPQMKAALVAYRGDVVHAHGLWQMPTIHAAQATRHTGLPLMVAPRGMLAGPALEYSPQIKRIFGKLWQDRALAGASAFHATAPSEYEDIRAFGLTQPVAILPNGVDMPDLPVRQARAQKTVLFLGRLHHKKGIDLLLQAWARVEAVFPDWRLRIIGPDENGHAALVAKMIDDLYLSRVTLESPVFGAGKWQAYFDADLFVLPTRSENFGMTVAESLAAEVPAICTKGAPWRGLEEHGCGWWIDFSPEALSEALHKGMQMPQQVRTRLGERGRVWMQKDFSWDRIARETAAVYAWLCNRGDRPDCVKVK